MSSFVYFDPDLSMIFLISLGIWLGSVLAIYKLAERSKKKEEDKQK